MSYVALDDNFPDHPKVAGLSDKAFRLHIAVLCRCGRFLTDGEAGKGMLVSVRYGTNAAAIKELVDAGLWEREGEGYRVHDYLVYNPSKAQVQAKRDAAKERMHAVRSHRVRANTESTASERSQELSEKCALPRSPSPSPPLSDPEFPSTSAEPPVDGASPQLALTPAPESESKRQRKPNPKREPTGNPNHKPLIEHYDAEFRRLRGGEPPPFGGREAGAVKRLLDQVGNDLERAKRIVSNGLSAQLGNPQTIVSIAADPARWTVAPPVPFQRGGGRQGPPQPDGGYRPEVVTTFDFEA
jgi:hypothetical protein